MTPETKEKVEQIKTLIKEGASVGEACEKAGLSTATWYNSKKKPKRVARKSTRSPHANGSDKETVMNALYRHVDFNTFQAVQSNWQ